MKNIIILLLYLLSFGPFRPASGQLLVVDPAVSGAIAVNSSTINGQLNTTNNRLDLIQRGQLAVTGQLSIINNLQNRIYQGMTQVSAVINNLSTIKDITDCGTDIVRDVGTSVTLARSNPVLLLFAEKGAREFQFRAVKLAADVSAFVLKGGNTNMMDAGERSRLLNHIATEMRILRGIAYGMGRSMYWAKMNGLLRTLNPWAEWQNQDVRIAGEVISNARYLRR